MSQPQAPRISHDGDNDTSDVSTPILTRLPASPPRPSSLLPSESTASESPKPAAVLPSNAHLRLPIPTPSANLSQTSFTFVDVSEDGRGVDFEDLPPEVTSADISIAREFLFSDFPVSRFCVFYAHISPYVAWCASVLYMKWKWVGVCGRIRPIRVLIEPFGTRFHFPVTNEASIFGHRFNFKASTS
jgi:hypothetical protein